MSKLKELGALLDKRAGVTIKESNSDREAREIAQLKITLERVQNGLNEIKGLPKSSPLLKESLQGGLDKRAGVHSPSRRDKSDSDDLQEGMRTMTRTRAGIRSGDIISTKVQKDLDEIFDVKESGTAVISDETIHISLREAKYDSSLDELETILEGAPAGSAALFSGQKMYLNKPTATQKRERPEGNLKDWASTITEAWTEGLKVMARIAVHEPWLKERLANPISKSGLRIEAEMKHGEPAGIYWLAQ